MATAIYTSNAPGKATFTTPLQIFSFGCVAPLPAPPKAKDRPVVKPMLNHPHTSFTC
jgi:hypothetical protein